MDRLLARLERRIGRYAIPNLIMYVVAGMGVVWLLSMTRPEVLGRLMLDMDAVRAGQVWRLVTFLFIPRGSTLWMVFTLYFSWWVGSSLEQHWGAFKFNVYYFLGVILTVGAATIAGGASNRWLNWSLFLAFATTFPDAPVSLMLILPIRVKWLGIAAALFIAYSFVESGDWGTRAAILGALGNYALFFGGHWAAVLRNRNVIVRQQAKREQFKNEPVFGQRECAICGAREADGADIRVCSCEKCGGQTRTLCLQHARSH
jgi:hypothetical protein